jgi:arylsulfatase A-like enzyme/Flp pilus assembly protein TadD
VILITIDTLRADHLACYGYTGLKTPNIDGLASEGTRFADAVAQVPLTLPSHCSILTGTYPSFHRVHDQTGHLQTDRPTLARLLKAQGYATAAFVSSFVLSSQTGLNEGFDHFDDAFGSSRVSRADELERRGNQTLSRALAWMAKVESARLFVWLHLYDPHAPYTPPEPFRSQYAGRPYDGEIGFVDSLIGQLAHFLKNKGLYSKTLIVFTADHGEDLGDHGEDTHGFFVYDSTVRIPLIIKAPGERFGATVIREPVQSVDIAPTILQMLSLPPGRDMQGKSLLSLIMHKDWHANPAIGETYYPFFHFGWSPLFFLRTDRYKFIDAPNPELYDLQRDPSELRNLFTMQRPLADRMRKQLLELLRRAGPAGGRSVSSRPVDEAVLEKLKSLGYLSYDDHPSLSEVGNYRKLPDPKQKLGIYNRFQSALLDEQNDHLRDAIQKFRQLTDLDSNVTDTYIDLGLCYKRLGQYDRAVEQFKKALLRDPRNTVASYNLAHTYALAGRTDEAMAGFQRTLQINPYESKALTGLGIAYQLGGDMEQAMAEYESALQINPSDWTALANLGTAFLSQGNSDKAIAYLKRALEINPKDAEAYNTLGSALLVKGDLTAAATTFRQAIGLKANYADAYVNLGLVLLQKGNTQDATSSLRKALEINPSSAYAHQLLGQTYSAQGMHEAAEGEFSKAKELSHRP